MPEMSHLGFHFEPRMGSFRLFLPQDSYNVVHSDDTD
jgi:hypothetical protein